MGQVDPVTAKLQHFLVRAGHAPVAVAEHCMNIDAELIRQVEGILVEIAGVDHQIDVAHGLNRLFRPVDISVRVTQDS